MFAIQQLEEIKRALELPYPSVLVVVGTGISCGASGDSRVTWKGLLEDGILRLELLGAKKASCEAALVLLRDAFSATPFDLSEVLQRAQSLTQELDKLGGMQFSEWIANSLGSIKISEKRRETIDAIANLQREGALLLTTNYDDLLCEATGLEPVTWQEPGEILKIITRRRKGIIHIHGHWRTPSSIILDTKSYSRLVQAATTQSVFRTLWMTLHWLYLGCGSGGVDDPNLGALLKWARDSNLGESALTDYFLSTQQAIDTLPAHVINSKTTVRCAYEAHDDLASIITAIRPEPKISPFELIDSHFSLVRGPSISPLDNPFPSWHEFQEGLVPGLAADEAVFQRLAAHGWALAFDIASVGKTTLALRIAARAEYRNSSRLYLSLKQDTSYSGYGDESPRAAMARAKRPGTLIIIDDAHLNPRLATQLWLQWKEQPFESQLLMLATSMDRLVYRPGESSLKQLQDDLTNPPLSVRADAQEMLAIAKYVLSRLRIDSSRINPPIETIDDWHHRFSGELGAFVISISQRRDRLLRGDYSLPEAAAQEWMWSRHLQGLSQNAKMNIACLAAFGRDGFELSLPEHCLPYQDAATRSQLLFSTLITRFWRKRVFHYSLREPGWSSLIRSALEPFPIGKAMVEALEKDLEFSLMFVQALAHNGLRELVDSFYSYLTSDLDFLVRRVSSAPLDASAWFLATAERQGYRKLTEQIWNALSSQPDYLRDQILAARPEASAWFLAVAKQQNQSSLAGRLWKSLGEDSKTLIERFFETSPEHVAYFIKLAYNEPENSLVDFLWDALAAEPDRLADWILRNPPDHGSRFIKTAVEHDVRPLLEGLWRRLDTELKRVSEWLLATRMDHSSSFIRAASNFAPQSFTDNLWKELVSDPRRLYNWAVQSSPGDLTAVISLADRQAEANLLEGFWETAMSNLEPLALAWKNCFASDLAGVLRHIPERYRAPLLQGLRLTSMKLMNPNDTERAFGLASLAEILHRYGQPDVADLLIEKLLHRLNSADFGAPQFALKELSRLLSIPTTKDNRFDELVRTIVTNEWLSSIYAKCKIQDLINSLFDIVLHQSPSIVFHFRHGTIQSRFMKVLREPDRKNLFLAIRLLGVSEMIGLNYDKSVLYGVSVERIALAATFLPRPDSAFKIAQCQQFWLGMHAVTQLVDKPLCIDPVSLGRARNLWTKIPPSHGDEVYTANVGLESRIAASMIEWLQLCDAAVDRRLVYDGLRLSAFVAAKQNQAMQ